jgi:anti-sigma factor ChrR (cupin superfamily)
MLERLGGEVARVTSIVRYAPGSRFSPHAHAGGEELLVLEGTFSDEHGDFPAGTYVRNPVGSSHSPHTGPGCLLLVKLHWMHPGDQALVRIDTRREDLWEPGEMRGVDVMELHAYEEERSRLYRLAAGAALPSRQLPGGEEIFVLEGECRDERGAYREGTWLRRAIGDAPALHADRGCRIYVKRGHLARPPPPPASGGDGLRLGAV